MSQAPVSDVSAAAATVLMSLTSHVSRLLFLVVPWSSFNHGQKQQDPCESSKFCAPPFHHFHLHQIGVPVQDPKKWHRVCVRVCMRVVCGVGTDAVVRQGALP